jgi:ferric-dicitrate binding protein FerR (iron transport regulator)
MNRQQSKHELVQTASTWLLRLQSPELSEAERVSKKTLIAQGPSKHAEVVTDAIIKLLQSE